MAKNFSIILFFSLFISAIFLVVPLTVNAATLSVSPSSGTYQVGDTITVRATVSSDVSLNAISGSISFPVGMFSIQSVSKSSSILNFWVTEPSFSNGSGVVKFEGVALGGFDGGSGTVITISLKALKTGSAIVSFQNAQILANDGQGTDITGSLNGATYSITEAKAPPVPAAPVQVEAPAPPPALPTLEAPSIVLGSKYGAPSILGTSKYPGSEVILSFLASDGVKVLAIGTADSDGGFTIVVPTSLRRGTYNVTALEVKPDGSKTDVSNLVIIEVGSIWSDLGWQVIGFIVLLILMIIYLLLRTFSHIKENRTEAMKREIRDAENLTHKSFDVLRDDVLSYDDDKLSPAERKKLSELKKDLDDAEKTIEKEIKNIE